MSVSPLLLNTVQVPARANLTPTQLVLQWSLLSDPRLFFKPQKSGSYWLAFVSFFCLFWFVFAFNCLCVVLEFVLGVFVFVKLCKLGPLLAVEDTSSSTGWGALSKQVLGKESTCFLNNFWKYLTSKQTGITPTQARFPLLND